MPMFGLPSDYKQCNTLKLPISDWLIYCQGHRPNLGPNCLQRLSADDTVGKALLYTEGKSLAIRGFPIGDLSSFRSYLLAGAQPCQLFENYLMATCKRSKATNLNFIARI